VAVTSPELLDSVDFQQPFVSAFDLTHVYKLADVKRGA
jgi:hypothetical protein